MSEATGQGMAGLGRMGLGRTVPEEVKQLILTGRAGREGWVGGEGVCVVREVCGHGQVSP